MNVPFEARQIDLMKGEHLRPEYLAINPFGKVPALKDGDFVLTESIAICTYLADKFPEKQMAPLAGTQERAIYNQWMLFCATELEAHLWAIEKNTWLYPERLRSQAGITAASHDFSKAAAVFDNYMLGRNHILNGGFSAADVIMGYVMNWAATRGLIADFPQLMAYHMRLVTRPAYPKPKA